METVSPVESFLVVYLFKALKICQKMKVMIQNLNISYSVVVRIGSVKLDLITGVQGKNL